MRDFGRNGGGLTALPTQGGQICFEKLSNTSALKKLHHSQLSLRCFQIKREVQNGIGFQICN